MLTLSVRPSVKICMRHMQVTVQCFMLYVFSNCRLHRSVLLEVNHALQALPCNYIHV